MNSYELSRKWFDFSYENPEKIKPNHAALYFFAIELCNRLGWKKKFGLPTDTAKDAIGIKNYKTYINTLNDLVDWGFIEMIEKSKNQYTANIIALVNFTKAHTKAHTKALDKANAKQVQSTYQGIASVYKQENNEQENNITIDFEKFKYLNEIVNKQPEGVKKNVFEFYESELQTAEDFDKKMFNESPSYQSGLENYKKFIQILFGYNSEDLVLKGVLSITNQLKYKHINELVFLASDNNKKIIDILEKIESKTDYWKNRTMLKTIIKNWCTNRFIKNN